MLLWFSIYLPVHFVLFVLVIRHRPVFRHESAIFLYHAVPATLMAVWVLSECVLAPGTESLFRAALVLAVQGIYSLSFLELWSLSQIGYSFHILVRFCAAGGTASAADLAALRQVGAGKREDRLTGLARLRLIEPDGDGYSLTGRGLVVASGLAALARLVHFRHLG